MGATITESSTWSCDWENGWTTSHGHVEDSVTVAPCFAKGQGPDDA